MNALLLATLFSTTTFVSAPQREGIRDLLDVCIDDVVVGLRGIGRDGSHGRVTSVPQPDRINQRQVGNRRRGDQ